MNKNKKLWIGVVSLVLAFLVFSVLLMIQKSMYKEPIYEEVICVKNAVVENVIITEQNANQYFEERRVPTDWIPSNYISDKESLYGMVLKTDLSSGTILTKNMVREYQEYYKEYENLTWIGVPIKELYKGVAGSIRSGDYIDIYILRKEEEIYDCSLIAKGVRVEAAYSEQGLEIKNDSPDGLSQLIIIPMEQEQVAVFYESLAQGDIRIAKHETS